MLGVAHPAIDGRRADGDLRTGPFLPAPTATLAHRHGDLELRAARGLGPGCAIERRVAQRGDECVIAQFVPCSSSIAMRA